MSSYVTTERRNVRDMFWEIRSFEWFFKQYQQIEDYVLMFKKI